MRRPSAEQVGRIRPGTRRPRSAARSSHSRQCTLRIVAASNWSRRARRRPPVTSGRSSAGAIAGAVDAGHRRRRRPGGPAASAPAASSRPPSDRSAPAHRGTSVATVRRPWSPPASTGGADERGGDEVRPPTMSCRDHLTVDVAREQAAAVRVTIRPRSWRAPTGRRDEVPRIAGRRCGSAARHRRRRSGATPAREPGRRRISTGHGSEPRIGGERVGVRVENACRP